MCGDDWRNMSHEGLRQGSRDGSQDGVGTDAERRKGVWGGTEGHRINQE